MADKITDDIGFKRNITDILRRSIDASEYLREE